MHFFLSYFCPCSNFWAAKKQKKCFKHAEKQTNEKPLNVKAILGVHFFSGSVKMSSSVIMLNDYSRQNIVPLLHYDSHFISWFIEKFTNYEQKEKFPSRKVLTWVNSLLLGHWGTSYYMVCHGGFPHSFLSQAKTDF